MFQLISQFRLLFSWLQRLAYLWLRSTTIPVHPQELLALEGDQPICYVLKTRSLTDLIVLDHHCRINGLPLPSFDPAGPRGAYNGRTLFLSRPGAFWKLRSKGISTGLKSIVEAVGKDSADAQLVPVSIFWGRNPDSEEKSFWKLLFFDDENGGMFQRCFVFWTHGRHIQANFGKPISIKNLQSEGLGAAESAKKLRRVLKVHFRLKREAVVGPYIYDRKQVIETVIGSRSVRDVVFRESQRKKEPIEAIDEQARIYADEIFARMTYSTIRLFEQILTLVWKRIFSGIEIKYGERPQDAAGTHELIYVPCHRSHMDYLLIGYVVNSLGLTVPHTASGINLNFWPVGSFLRRAGAFFIRRSFGGDRLYGAVFSEYVHYLIQTGFPISFYPEGGRSRTGLLLKPKTGLLLMILQSLERRSGRPIAFIPVSIAYDKMIEGRTYLREIGGRAKKAESFRQLLAASKILKSEFGKAYMSFGEPILVDESHSLQKVDDRKSGSSLSHAAAGIADEIMVRINESSAVSPIALFAVLICGVPQRTMDEHDLVRLLDLLSHFLRKTPYSSNITVVEHEPALIYAYVQRLLDLQKLKYPVGDVIVVEEQQWRMLFYYRNNIKHVFVLHSIIASCFKSRESMERGDLVQVVALIYKAIQDTYFLRSLKDADAKINAVIELFVEEQLLYLNGSQVQRPQNLTSAFTYLKIVGSLFGDEVEAYNTSRDAAP